MPRNFDELLEDDMSFVLGGETFTMKYVRPEVLAAWEDEPDVETAADSLVEADAKIKLFILESEYEKYDALRQREENPVTTAQLNALIRWMIEVQTGRPTMPLSDSEPGPGSTEATSTVASTPARGRMAVPRQRRAARR